MTPKPQSSRRGSAGSRVEASPTSIRGINGPEFRRSADRFRTEGWTCVRRVVPLTPADPEKGPEAEPTGWKPYQLPPEVPALRRIYDVRWCALSPLDLLLSGEVRRE